MDDKLQRRNTFDQDADQYERSRPGYPEALFEDIIALSSLPEDGQILEIGCGTGQATLPFARRGFSITCIELGENLAAIARRNLTSYPKAKVSIGGFEDFPLLEDSFDLVMSATAFHWIDPEIGYQKVNRILKPEGAMALFWNKPVQTEISAAFTQSVQSIYMEVIPEIAKDYQGLPYPDAIQLPIKEEIDRTGKFGKVTVKKYKWDREYTAKEYTNLLSTFSDHIALDQNTRERLLERIEDQIETKFDNRIVREHLTILYLAKCKKA